MMAEVEPIKASLPDAFADIEQFVGDWAVPGMANRARCRDNSTPAERQAFYDGMRNRVVDILDYLGDKPLSEFKPQETLLLNLALSFGHVALAIEIQGDTEATHVGSRVHMKIG